MGNRKDEHMSRHKSHIDKDNPLNSRMYWILFIFFILVSGLVYFFLRQLFGEQVGFFSPGWFQFPVVLQLILLLGIYFGLDTLRLFYILKTLEVDIDFWYVFYLALINIFISNVTPFATGGGFVQLYLLHKKGVPLGKATAATSIRTLLAVLFFFLMIPIIVWKQGDLLRMHMKIDFRFFFFIIFFFYFLIGLLCYFIIYQPHGVKKTWYVIMQRLQKRKWISEEKAKKMSRSFFRELEQFSKGMRLFLYGNKKYIVLSFVTTLLFLVSLFSFSILLTGGMGYNIPLSSIIRTEILVTFITYFAITPGAAGIAEGSYVYLYGKYIAKNDLAVLAFGWRFFTIYIGVILGAICFYREMIGRLFIRKK